MTGLVVGVVGGLVANALEVPASIYGFVVGGLAGGCSAVVLQKMNAAEAGSDTEPQA